jgi:hypothetical protein
VPGLVDELVPGIAAVVDDVVVGLEDAVREPVVAHELPDILDRIEFGRLRRQRHNGDVGGHDQFRRQMPSGLVGEKDGVGSRCDPDGDLGEMQVHRLGVASRQDQGRALALLWADRTEDVGGGCALVMGCAGASAALGPASGDLVLLADARLVLEPDFYLVAVDSLLTRDLFQTRREAFLKSSIAPSAWA